MKIISIRELANELNIDETCIQGEIVEVINKLENSKTHYLLNTAEKRNSQIYVTNEDDVAFIESGNGTLCFMDLAVHFNVPTKNLNWLLSEMLKKGLIQQQTYEYYVDIKTINKPSVKAQFEPAEVVVGDKVTLNIEVNSPCEILEPKLLIEQIKGLDVYEEPKLPNKFLKGKRLDKFQYETTSHGTPTPKIKLGGIIEGVEFGPDEVAAAHLTILPLSPDITVTSTQDCYDAVYQKPFRLSIDISNKGSGTAQNVELKGLDKHPEFEATEPTKIGNVAPHGIVKYRVGLKPKASGIHVVDDYSVYYEDLIGKPFSSSVPRFEVSVTTPQPKLKVEILAPDIVEPKRVFQITVQISNIGEGNARNIAFTFPIDQKNIQSGTVACSFARLRSNETENIPFRLQALDNNDFEIPDFNIAYSDEEEKALTDKIFGVVIPVEKIGEVALIQKKTQWPFKENSIIGGQYQIVEEIGEGGFAKVYKVRRAKFHEEMALKALKADLVGNPTIVENFIDEAKVARDLREDHIVSVMYVDTENLEGVDFPYIIMEYVKGGTLRNRLPPGESLDLMTCVTVMNDMCAALLYAHQHNIAHFDVKPSNIFYDDKKNLWKLGDFGLARALAVNETMSPRGSLPYMAPEIREKKGSTKSDIYSLGRVFREILTGDLNGDVRKLERLWGIEYHGILKEIADIIDRMLSRNPFDRPSIGEIQKILSNSRTWPAKMSKRGILT